jgi:hypothetical protein
MSNRYIDVQAPWALKKSDPERMETVLWVLMESLRAIALVQQPFTPTIASNLLDQLGVGAEARTFQALVDPAAKVEGGSELPKPRIIVPRYEPPEPEGDAADAGSAGVVAEAAPVAAMSSAELAELEARVREQGEAVRLLKTSGAGKDEVGGAVATLLELKAKLPEGHELLGGGKKKKAKK